MNLTKEQKVEKSQNLSKEIKDAGVLFFVSYQGLKFVDMADLRKSLIPTGAKFRVERNSIVGHAIKQAGIEGADEKLFKGPTAIALGGDVAAVAKELVDFSKKFEALKLRSCFSDGTWYSEAQIKQLASIGSKEDNLSKLAGALYSAVAQSAQVLQAPIRDFAYVLKAVEDSKK
ncbi:Ribosomal protein L10 [Elusimicrobium minutum Pei191]|uniref:Large ribosomal subunit protein uL10 n=1 Tax=Elusimicrobium minutum (strain Pei191) TaxID=445932 RepID=B2KEN3_ELUMP|nr:50S ribosomal protein L10 [Elusimicrobium minutum]ACC98979.1 Ribosomal protein L10 [Elusimicrobium minutum Pei191]